VAPVDSAAARRARRRVDDIARSIERRIDALLATQVAADLNAQGANDLVRWIQEHPHELTGRRGRWEAALSTAALIDSDTQIFDACAAHLAALAGDDVPTRDELRAREDVIRARELRSGVDARYELRDRVGALLERMVADGEDDALLVVVERFWTRLGDERRAARMNGYTDVQRTGALDLIRARRTSGLMVDGHALLDQLSTLPADPVAGALAHRDRGILGDAAARALVFPGAHDGYDAAMWRHVAARRAEWPTDDDHLPLIPLRPEDLDQWQAEHQGDPAFAGWRVGVMDQGETRHLFLVGPLVAEDKRRVGVRVHLKSYLAPEPRSHAGVRGAALAADGKGLIDETVEIVDIESDGVPDLPLPVPSPGATIAAPRCDHAGARWQPNRPHDALSLVCPTCTRRALAVVPLHMAPGVRPEIDGSPERYLQRERYYAALRGDEPPESFADLQRRDGMASLEIGDHLPHLAPPPVGPADDLAGTLFG